MTYEEFLKFVPAKCIYETIYEDTEGRPILVISLLDAYGMVNKAQRPWVGLTEEEVKHLYPYGRSVWGKETFEAIEKALKEKNSAN